MTDEYIRDGDNFVPLMNNKEDRPIDPISDIGITIVNDVMFDSSYAKSYDL